MRNSVLLLGFGALLVVGVVLSQIELSFVRRSPTTPTNSAPSSEALALAELRSKELEVKNCSCSSVVYNTRNEKLMLFAAAILSCSRELSTGVAHAC